MVPLGLWEHVTRPMSAKAATGAVQAVALKDSESVVSVRLSVCNLLD